LAEARGEGVEIISDIELASRFMSEQTLAVAGTNGKTTTATLLGKVFADAGKPVFVGGNIGTPVLDNVEGEEEPEFSVLEVSSFQLEGINTFSPHVAILLNITEDHLYRYEDFDDYAGTKFRIFMNQQESDFAIVNMDDPAISERVAKKSLKARLIELRPEAKCLESVSGDCLTISGEEIIFKFGAGVERYPTEGFGLIGGAQAEAGQRPDTNSIENIMAVIACARIAGIERENIIESINGFTGLKHRMEFLGVAGGVTYINDSKATNPASVVRALEGLAGPVVLIAGGKEKGCDYGVLTDAVKEKVRVAILCGEAAPEIDKSLSGVTDTILVATFDEAVAMAHSKSKAGETVILSPACSSFDEFESFSARGERFKTLVEEF
jgi:UDP-N-acetylmuramoylalanine--D-glutamate ligase